MASSLAKAAAGVGCSGCVVGGLALFMRQKEIPEVKRKGILVVCGPSGVGKGTLLERLMQEHRGQFGFSVSHTTRGPRQGEQDTVHYNFTSKEKMQEEINANKFLESAHVHGNIYGTSFDAVDRVKQSGRVCLLDIDVQGAEQMKNSHLNKDAAYLFVMPPSMEELEQRLRKRGTETEDKIKVRLKNAQGEMAVPKEKPEFFDKVLVNNDLDKTYEEFKKFVQTEVTDLTTVTDKGVVVIVGPSGVGKGTLLDRLQKEHEGKFGFSVSHTTRAPRQGEQDGVHYNFTSKEKMREEISASKFLEHAEVHGNFYGTSFAAVERVKQSGKVCLLDIDVQGAQQMKGSHLNRDAAYLFVMPPSMEALEQRLRGRGTEKEDKIQVRLKNAQGEVGFANKQPDFFDKILVNNDLEKAYSEFNGFIKSTCGKYLK